MYQVLLTNRYLTSRVIPLIAVLAVALCVALVIIVVSVMTGFLNNVKQAGRTLMGDVVVTYAISGIPHYDALIERIEALPEAAAATPVVDGFGLVKMPYPEGPQKESAPVQIWGIEPEGFARVTGYDQTLYWRELTDQQRELLFIDLLEDHWRDFFDMLDEEGRLGLLRTYLERVDPGFFDERSLVEHLQALAGFEDAQLRRLVLIHYDDPQPLRDLVSEEQWNRFLSLDARLVDPEALLRQGLTLKQGNRPGIALGLHVSIGNERQQDGSTIPARNWFWWMPRYEVVLTTIPIDLTGGVPDPESVVYSIVNEFQSGVFLIDNKRVMIPLAEAQDLMRLGEQMIFDEDGEEVLGTTPARATMVLVRAADGFTPDALQQAVEGAYDTFEREYRSDPTPPPIPEFGLRIQTWEKQQEQFIGPVEKERELMRTLFSLVYIVCAGLVLAIFWAIVYEKTRDIGILRSIGASRLGISWIFLRYGLTVGVLGAILGLGLGYLVVHNINAIHDAMGDPPLWIVVLVGAAATAGMLMVVLQARSGRFFPLVLASLVTIVLMLLEAGVLWIKYYIGGVIMWTPETYYFATIPNELDLGSAIGTMIGAVIFSLVGVFLPAARAADTDPVVALRHE